MALSLQRMNANDVYNADTVNNANCTILEDNVVPAKIMTMNEYNHLEIKDLGTLYLVNDSNKIYAYVGTIPFAESQSGTSPATGEQTLNFGGTTASTTGVAGGINTLNSLLLTAPEDPTER